MTQLVYETPGKHRRGCVLDLLRELEEFLFSGFSPLTPPLPAGWIQNAKWGAEPENSTRQMDLFSREAAMRPSRLLWLYFGGQTMFCSILGSQEVSNWFTQSLFVVVIFCFIFVLVRRDLM